MAGAAMRGDSARLGMLVRKMRGLSDPRFRTALSRGLAEESVKLANDSFRQQRDHFGKAWKPALRGGQTLRDKGTLQRSITYSGVSPSGWSLSSGLVYARIHNEGGTIRAKTAKGLRFMVDAGHDIATARTNRKTRRTSYRRRKAVARKKMVIVQSVTMPRRSFIPSKTNGGWGPIWADALRQETDRILRRFLGV